MALVLVVLLLPISVYAGTVRSLLNNIFENQNQEDSFSTESIQNMSLLVAATSPLLGSSRPSSFPIIEDNALVSDNGHLGAVNEFAVSKPASDQISVYIVREGDTLSQIAEMFNVTMNTIRWGNDLQSNTLKVGDTLVILPVSGIKHTVVRGDTIESLAKKYKGDVEEIKDYNNLESEKVLAINSVIIIPDGEAIPRHPSNIGSPATKTDSSLKEYRGYYLRPIAGGRRSQGLHRHNAIDIAAPIGTPIFASADGEVIISRSSGWNGGYGNYIVIRHNNGTQTLYAHNSKNMVSPGDTVKQGEVIGLVGASGRVTGPHVHFEIRGAKNPF